AAVPSPMVLMKFRRSTGGGIVIPIVASRARVKVAQGHSVEYEVSLAGTGGLVIGEILAGEN
ncbi:unnamed protein product, partial [marine sediment metagenome]